MFCMLCKVYVRANSGWEGWQNATMMVGKAGDGFLFEPLLHPHQVICGLLWVLGGKQWNLHHQAAKKRPGSRPHPCRNLSHSLLWNSVQQDIFRTPDKTGIADT